MNILSREKSILLWGLYILAVIAVLWWVAETIARGAPARKFKFPTQASGAEDLIAPKNLRVLTRSSIPILSVAPNPLFNTYRFTVGDISGSNCIPPIPLWWTNTVKAQSITLAWDRVLSNCDGSPVNYLTTNRLTVWRVMPSTTNTYPAGTNLQITVPLVRKGTTNVVVTLTTANATNLQWRLRADSGSWTKLGATNWSYTNPPTRYWRAMGKTRPSLFINSTWQ